jgi:hypothetical protein
MASSDKIKWPFQRLYSLTLANRIDRPDQPEVCRYSFQKTCLHPPRDVDDDASLTSRDPVPIVPLGWLSNSQGTTDPIAKQLYKSLADESATESPSASPRAGGSGDSSDQDRKTRLAELLQTVATFSGEGYTADGYTIEIRKKLTEAVREIDGMRTGVVACRDRDKLVEMAERLGKTLQEEEIAEAISEIQHDYENHNVDFPLLDHWWHSTIGSSFVFDDDSITVKVTARVLTLSARLVIHTDVRPHYFDGRLRSKGRKLRLSKAQ